MKTINLYGPTHFSEILSENNDLAEAQNCTQMNQRYNLLLILTDGIINDMQKTIDQIVRGSDLATAIIIVGVGDADFDSMDQLDADEEALYSQAYRKYMSADIVQFVPFNEFKGNPHLLAKEILEEVPGQLLTFMRKNNIQPHPRTEQQRQAL